MCYSVWYNAPTMLPATGRQHRGCIIPVKHLSYIEEARCLKVNTDTFAIIHLVRKNVGNGPHVLVDLLMHVRDYLVCKNAPKFSRREVFDEFRDGIGLLKFRKSVMLFFVNGAFHDSPQINNEGV